MGLLLKIISGTNAGQVFPITNGAVIGRANVEIKIDDPKISGKHAKFEKDPSGVMKIMDLGSTNGIYHGDKRVASLSVTPGVKLRVGGTVCEILAVDIEDHEPLAQEKAPESVQSDISVGLPPIPEIEELEVAVQSLSWSEYFSDLAKRLQSQIPSQPKKILPFQKLVRLKCVRGLHMGQSWVLGYGPREIGRLSLDIPLMDEGCPDIAFTLSPEGEHVRFQTNALEKVKLNGISKKTEIVNDGDQILINSSLYRLDFIK